jgi:hypothetical protein
MSNNGIVLDMQTKKMIQKLGKRGNLLQIVAAETLNDQEEQLEKRYRSNLKKNQTLRNERFTMGAIKSFKSRPVRKSGEPRRLNGINAILAVKKQKNLNTHYLEELETGSTNRGNSKTLNKSPAPLTASRTAMNEKKPIASANRILKNPPQKLRAGGKVIGVSTRERRKNGRKWATPQQRFAALYRFKKQGGAGLQGDLSKPFFFIDNSNHLGIFKFIRNRARKIRSLRRSTTRTNASPNFKKAVNATSPNDIKKDFVRRATQELKKVGK